MRAAELLPGAHLVFTATTLKGSEPCQRTLEWFYDGWKEVLKLGLISQEEFQSLAGGHWLRSREEWLAPLEGSGELKDRFEVLEFQEHALSDPHWMEYVNGKGPQAEKARELAEAYAGSMFGVGGGLLKGHLKQRSAAEVDKVLEVMRARFIELGSSEVIEFKMPFVLMVLRKK